MPIRMSGIVSGFDTESMVKELMSAQTLKKTKVEKAKTKLEWKQTKWSDLNTKLTGLYNNYVSKMQLSSSYKTKKASTSDSSKVSVTANGNTPNGSYTLEVNNIATSQYLTGGKISATTASTKLSALDSSLVGKTITVKAGEKEESLTIDNTTTLSDLVTTLNNAGLNANYDTNQQRLFISSKDSGLKNTFSITTTGATEAESTSKKDLQSAIGYASMSASNKAIVDKAMTTLQSAAADSDEYTSALNSIAKAMYDTKADSAQKSAITYVSAKLYGDHYDAYETEAKEELKSQYFDDDGNLLEGKTQEDYDAAVAKLADEKTAAYVTDQTTNNEDVKLEIDAYAISGTTQDEMDALSEVAKNRLYKNGATAFDGTKDLNQDDLAASIADKAKAYAEVQDRTYSSAGALSGLGLADIAVDANGKVTIDNGDSSKVPEDMVLIEGSDSEILLNGAKLTSSSATVSANGLSIDLIGTTEAGKPITFSVEDDVDTVYDSIKSFLKEYNSVMKEMYTLYNAKSAKDYEPLTSDEKEAMTDDEIEQWETKIKDSLLRSDSTLNSIMQGMRSAMMSTVSYNGKNYALSSFGIMTSTDYTEGGQLHIYGDTDDSVYSSQDDKLKKALKEDPDAVINTLTGVFGNLRKTMSNQMAGTKYSSALTFYNDIKMKDDISDYEDEIEDWEDRLADLEDSYYDKFSAMETALAKLQSQTNSLSSLFGS